MPSDFKNRFVIPDFKPQNFFNQVKDIENSENLADTEKPAETENVEIGENTINATLPTQNEVDNKEESQISEYNLIEIENNLKTRFLLKLNTTPVWFDYSKDSKIKLITDFTENFLKVENLEISEIDKSLLIYTLVILIAEFGPVQYLIDKDNVDAIYINSTKNINIEIAGKVLNTETHLTEDELKFLINILKNKTHKNIFEGVEKFRVNNLLISVIADDISTDGINITFRKQKEYNLSLIENESIMPKEVFDFIINCVNSKKNILISGGINTLKTTVVDILIKQFISESRTVLLENYPQIISDSNLLVKFNINKNDKNYTTLISEILKSEPEYIAVDTNSIIPEICERKGIINTIRANSIENALKNSVNCFISEGINEKLAKSKVLNEFDYLLQFNKISDGTVKLAYLTELKPAKTAKDSIKTLVKYANGKFDINLD